MDNTKENVAIPSLDQYYYGEQLRKYILQFGAIFWDLKVGSGKNDYADSTSLIRVPVYYGSMDRVVASIKSDNTQNKALRVPAASFVMTGMSLNPDRMSGLNQEKRSPIFPLGGDVVNDTMNLVRAKPLPYDITFELSVIVSNTDQRFQILEQILLLFDPTLQLQISDSYKDWTKINDVILDDINFEDNYPPGADRRLIITNFTFTTRGYLSPPANIKNDLIKKIKLRVDTVTDIQEAYDKVYDQSKDGEYMELINLFTDADIPRN